MGRWIIFFCFFFYSCAGVKTSFNFSSIDKHITFEKINVKFKSQPFGNIHLKGYIILCKDSLICFKFFGPLSMEVFSGVYLDTFKVYDRYNDVVYKNAESKIFSQTDIAINRQVIEFMLLGKIELLTQELMRINSPGMKFKQEIKDNKLKCITVDDLGKHFSIKFSLKSDIPGSIYLAFKDTYNEWECSIENISITNRIKKCNFGQ